MTFPLFNIPLNFESCTPMVAINEIRKSSASAVIMKGHSRAGFRYFLKA